jgi:peroxiredoxin
MKLCLPGLLFVLLALAVPLFAQNDAAAVKTNPVAPPFDVTSLQGKTFKLEELKGKYVVLNFWFIHCAPCLRELPQLNKLVTAYGKRNFVFIAFATDNKYDLESFLKKKPFAYNIIPKGLPVVMKYHDPAGSNVSFPTHVIIDPKGEIVFRAEGASGLAPLQKELKRLAALK